MSDLPTEYSIIRRDLPTMYFIGVTTTQSTMTRLFPAWAEILGLHAQLIGVDLPLQASPELYRQAVAQIKYDPLSMGALITSHKIDLAQAAGDMFDEFDLYARFCHEVSCISKRAGRLRGLARDPLNSVLALQHILGAQYWGRSEAHVLCLGAGGAGTALAVGLLTQRDPAERPRRLLLVNDHRRGLDRLRAIVERIQRGQSPFPVAPAEVEVLYIENCDPRRNDELVAALPPGSLVVNATGMGKDRPGSPVTDACIFPQRGIAWELNYRGELAFLHQAEAQRERRDLNVHDGWYYFVNSWIDNIAEVFNLEVTQQHYLSERPEAGIDCEAARNKENLRERLAAKAEELRR